MSTKGEMLATTADLPRMHPNNRIDPLMFEASSRNTILETDSQISLCHTPATSFFEITHGFTQRVVQKIKETHFLSIPVLIMLLFGCIVGNAFVGPNQLHSKSYPLSKFNIEQFNDLTTTSSKIPQISISPSSKIYGPFDSQPKEMFQPFNAGSLIFVSFIFTTSWLLSI